MRLCERSSIELHQIRCSLPRDVTCRVMNEMRDENRVTTESIVNHEAYPACTVALSRGLFTVMVDRYLGVLVPNKTTIYSYLLIGANDCYDVVRVVLLHTNQTRPTSFIV